MRQNPNNPRRSRGRGNNNRKPGNSRNQIFDSNGPGARVRGNSAQIYEKYQQLARDASSAGDRVAAEGFYQHAEHYYRLMDAAGLNRDGTPQDQSQQQNEGAAQNNGAAQNTVPAQNNEADQNDDAVQNDRPVQNSETVVAAEAAPRPTPRQAPQHAPESVAALIEAVESGNTDQQDQATNGNGSGADEAKPARRPRPRRSNGSANGQSKPVKAAEVETPEDDSDKTEDTGPVSA
jgi:hypothetical protein